MNRIVGYTISDRTAKLAVDALRNAVTRRGEVAGCILHPIGAASSAVERWPASCAVMTWSLGGSTPIEFEAKLAEPLTLAA